MKREKKGNYLMDPHSNFLIRSPTDVTFQWVVLPSSERLPRSEESLRGPTYSSGTTTVDPFPQ